MEIKHPTSLSNDGPLIADRNSICLEIEFYSIKEQITDIFYVMGYGPLILIDR